MGGRLTKWTAQLPAQQKWSERRGTYFEVQVWNEDGEHVASAFGETAPVAERRALRIERRTPAKEVRDG